jgi:Uma2 family endonuclease
VEVLSDSTRAFDLVRKVEEYKSVQSLRHIVLVDTAEPKIVHWSRPDAGSWTYRTIEGLQAVLEVPDLKLSLQLETFYRG